MAEYLIRDGPVEYRLVGSVSIPLVGGAGGRGGVCLNQEASSCNTATRTTQYAMRQLMDQELAAQMAELAKQQRLEQENAYIKAEALLRRNLKPRQLKIYDKFRTVRVYGRSGRLYEVSTRGVHLIEQGIYKTHYCINAADTWLPTPDRLLSKILMIQGAEDYFLRTAVPSPSLEQPAPSYGEIEGKPSPKLRLRDRCFRWLCNLIEGGNRR